MKFKEKALNKESSESTLFVIVADVSAIPSDPAFASFWSHRRPCLSSHAWQECHYAPTQGGAHSSYINDPELCALPNFLVLLNSATPYNCLTQYSRLTGLETNFSDPLQLSEGDVSNVIRWRPNGKGRYRHIDLYMDSIAFRVPELRRSLKLSVQLQADYVPYDVPLFQESDRFASMTSVAVHVTERLKSVGAPLTLKYDKRKLKYVFQPTIARQAFRLRLDLEGQDFPQDSVLPLLGFTSSQAAPVSLQEKASQLVQLSR